MKRCYKMAIVGFGSIGKRHLLNIVKVLERRGIEFSIDLIRRAESGCVGDDIKGVVNEIYTDFNLVPNDYEVIFVTNPTYLHYDTIKRYVEKTKHMFIEKPVFSDHGITLDELKLKENGIYYVACPLRYTDVIQYIKKKIRIDKVHSARAICSSYLPEWRPESDYRDSYSAHKEQGGGVSIDLIHEWDYMLYLFGKPEKIANMKGTISDLQIDSDDISIYIAMYDNMMAEVHLDYFGKKTIRELQLFTSDETIVADIANSEVEYLKSKKTISFKESRNDFQIKEIEYFFDIIAGKERNTNDIKFAIETLKIAKEGKV